MSLSLCERVCTNNLNKLPVGLISLTPTQFTAADVTGNAAVSATDASWIARKAVDPSIVFPVEQ